MTFHMDSGQAGAVRQRRFLVFAAGYSGLWLALWYASALLEQNSGISLWFLPAGLRFACLLLLGWRGLVLELMTAFLLLILQLLFSTGPAPGLPSFQTLSFFFNLFAYAGAYALVLLPLRRVLRNGFDFTQSAHGFLFLGSALAVAGLAAAAGTAYLTHTGALAGAPWQTAFASWALGDFIGIITFAPLLQVQVWPRLQAYLMAGTPDRPAARADRRVGEDSRRNLHVVAIAVAATGAVILVAREMARVEHVPIVALLLLPPLAVITLRYNLRGAVLAVALFGTGMVVTIALLEQRLHAFPYQLVMIAIALVGLWLGGAVEARHRLMKRSQDFADVANDLLWEIDGAGRLVTLDGRMARLVARHLGRPWQVLLAGASASQRASIEQTLAQRRTFVHLDVELRRGSARRRWVQLNGLPVHDDAGTAVAYRGTARDVSRDYRARELLRDYGRALESEVAQRTRELRRSHDELALKEQRLNLTFAADPVGVLEFDEGGGCTYLNAHAEGLSGWSGADAPGRLLLDFVHPQHRGQVAATMAQLDTGQEVGQFEFRMDRTGLWCGAHWSRLPPTAAGAGRTVVVVTDVTSRHEQQELLWLKAHHDALTGLPNRTLFSDRCSHALSLARRHGTMVALLWIDLDDFKPVNDQLGHAAGDVLLHQVAQRMKTRLRDSDTLARIGGDEFAVVLPDIKNLDHAMAVASDLVASLAGAFDLPQGQATVSCSAGVALYPQHAQDCQALERCADAALYGAKSRRKGSVWVWDNPC